jgi:DNA-binding CsgD family transcriptional regulator
MRLRPSSSSGGWEEASRLADRLEAHGRKLDRPWALATGARSRALVDAASGDLQGTQAWLESSARAHERLPQRFELARTLLLTGSIQRRRKKKREARESLRRAEAMFSELGALLWVDKTRAELGRIGGRAASPFELTPTEERIARLVAEGQTNREVAASLFLSVKTVETNLTRIYRKLGVSSRRQLAQRVRSGSSR